MKLLPKKQKFSKLIVTDIEGETKTFDTVKELVEFLGVNASRVYTAIKKGGRVRGCTIQPCIFDD